MVLGRPVLRQPNAVNSRLCACAAAHLRPVGRPFCSISMENSPGSTLAKGSIRLRSRFLRRCLGVVQVPRRYTVLRRLRLNSRSGVQ